MSSVIDEMRLTLRTRLECREYCDSWFAEYHGLINDTVRWEALTQRERDNAHVLYEGLHRMNTENEEQIAILEGNIARWDRADIRIDLSGGT